MDGANLAHVEALMNIVGNGAEILAIATGGPLLFLWWIPKVNGTPGYSIKLFLLGLVMVVLGLATPAAINYVAATRGVEGFSGAGIGVLVFVAIVLVIMCGIVYLLPTYFALYVQKKKNAVLIVLLNLLGFFPPCWLFALQMSTTPDKEVAAIHAG